MPVYGQGLNVRDWLFVDDHAQALTLVLERGRVGRDLQHRRQRRAAQHRCRERDLRRDGSTCATPERRAVSRADHALCPIVPVTISATRSILPSSTPSSAGTEALLRSGPATDREMVHRQSRLVGTVAVRARRRRPPWSRQEERVSDAPSPSWRDWPGRRRVPRAGVAQRCRACRARLELNSILRIRAQSRA